METVSRIPVSKIKIEDNENSLNANMRKVFDAQKAASLRENIRTTGLIYSLIVRHVKGEYILLGGERRLRSILKLLESNASCWSQEKKAFVSARELYEQVPVKIFECDDVSAIGLAVSDNVERENLSEVEKIEACLKLDNATATDGEKLFTRAKIADIFRTSESWVSQTVSIGNLPRCVMDALNEGVITRTVAIQLLKTDPNKIEDVLIFARQLVERDLTDKINSAMLDVKEAKADFSEAKAASDTAELRYKQAPQNKKLEASKLMKKSEEALQSSVRTLDQAQERLKALNKGGTPYNITADVITSANERLGTQTGKGRPLSIKQVRELKEQIIAKHDAAKLKGKKANMLVAINLLKIILREEDMLEVDDIF